NFPAKAASRPKGLLNRRAKRQRGGVFCLSSPEIWRPPPGRSQRPRGDSLLNRPKRSRHGPGGPKQHCANLRPRAAGRRPPKRDGFVPRRGPTEQRRAPESPKLHHAVLLRRRKKSRQGLGPSILSPSFRNPVIVKWFTEFRGGGKAVTAQAQDELADTRLIRLGFALADATRLMRAAFDQ